MIRKPISATMLSRATLPPPATMIGHETAAIEEPEPAVVETIEPVATAVGCKSAARLERRESPHGLARA